MRRCKHKRSAIAAAVVFAGGPFNSVIAPGSHIDANSANIVARLTSRTPIADVYAYGVPVWTAGASTSHVRVHCTEPWGTCQLEDVAVPIPAAAKPSSGSDAAMVVVDKAANKSYEFWQAHKIDATHWSTSWGGIVALDGPGTPGQAVGSGMSRLAGVVRMFEIRAGKINHALVFSSQFTCSTFRYPATKSDGHTAAPCIPEGARVQLDPNVNVATLNLSPAVRTVAQALQTFGAYAVDTGGAPMAYIFEDPAGRADPYPTVGLSGDYAALSGIPWNRLRVLA